MHLVKNFIVDRLKRDKKGALAIEIAIGIFMFLIIVCAMMDVLILTWKFQVISQTNSFVARTAALQGGVLYSAPEGFPGGDAAYISVSEMNAKIKDNFQKAGIESGDYVVTVNGSSISAGASTGEIDYRKPIQTEIRVKYKWLMLSNFIPGNIENWISSKRSALSEFKYRYDSWQGE